MLGEIHGDFTAFGNGPININQCRPVPYPKGTFGLGLGGLGASFNDARERLGEFIAVSGTAVVMPTDGSRVADYSAAAGDLVPTVISPYALKATGEFSHTVRFQSQTAGDTVALPRIAEAMTLLAGSETVAMVMIAVSAGLVGASLRVSPAGAGYSGAAFDVSSVRRLLRVHRAGPSGRLGLSRRHRHAKRQSGSCADDPPSGGHRRPRWTFSCGLPELSPITRGRHGARRGLTAIVGSHPHFRCPSFAGRCSAGPRFGKQPVRARCVLGGAAAHCISAGTTLGLILNSLTIGLILSFVALSIYLTYGNFHFPDLTTDGAFTLGAACSAKLMIAGVDPVSATLAGALAGAAGGALTGILHVALRFPPTLAGILVMTALYSINLRIMGQSNLSLYNVTTLYDLVSWGLSGFIVNERLDLFGLSLPIDALAELIVTTGLVILGVLCLRLLLSTRAGTMIRAAGENPQMVHSLGVSSRSMLALAVTLGNALTGLAGSLLVQYQGFADIQIGIGMVVSGFASVFIGRLLIANRGLSATLSTVVVGAVLFRLALAAVLWLGVPSEDLKVVMVALVVAVLVISDASQRRSRAVKRRP